MAYAGTLMVCPALLLVLCNMFFRVCGSHTGDILALSISHLDSLVQRPLGCGEQNMIHFAPSIYVLLYLDKSTQDNQELRSQAVAYLKEGKLALPEHPGVTRFQPLTGCLGASPRISETVVIPTRGWILQRLRSQGPLRQHLVSL